MAQPEFSADELLAALGAVRRTVRRVAGRPWPTTTLTDAQLELLRLVGREPGISVARAAEELGVAANTVSTLVGALTRGDLLERRTDDTDRRVGRLTLTPAISDRVASWRDLRATMVSAATDALSLDDRAALAEAVPALQRLAERLRDREDPR